MTRQDDLDMRTTTAGRRPLTLERVGTILFGDRWQSELSRKLHVNDRTVRRWHSGESVLPPHIWDALHGLVKARAAEFEEASTDLERHRDGLRTP